MKRTVFLLLAGAWALIVAAPPVIELAAANNTIRGRVVDAETGGPVAGAVVAIQASLEDRAEIAADGSFTIRTSRETGELVVVAAGAPGRLNDQVAAAVGDTGVDLALSAISPEDTPDYEFSDPQDCRLCHTRIFDEWRDAGHRNAAKNTWVKDLYDGSGTPGTGSRGFTFKGAHPSLHGDCAECHAPAAAARNPGDLTDYTAVTGGPYEWGVSCDLCHKTTGIVHPDLPGVLGMTFARGSRETMFGPYADSAPNFPGLMRAAYSPLHADSLLCSACHEDNSDHDFDGDYLEAGSVPSEATYSEWAASRYAQPGPQYRTCQDCHMQPKGATTAAEQYGSVERDPSQVSSHDFEGTTDEYLKNAATVRLVAARADGRLVVDAAVTNDRTGHDLPSGVTSRNVILLVRAVDAEGDEIALDAASSSVVPEWGGVGDPAEGYYAGLAGRGFAKVLTDGPTDNVLFTEATGVKSDNRIAAGATDWSRYVFEAGSDVAPVRVEARLIYRRAFRDLVDLKGWRLTGQGRPNPDLIAPHFGVLMASDEVAVAPVGTSIDTTRIQIGRMLRLRTAGRFDVGTTLELTDESGAWQRFDAPARTAAGGRRLDQKGKIAGMRLGAFWPDGAVRFLRVSSPDGAQTVLRLSRVGGRLVPAP
jgi:hypothetical protein